MATVKLYYYVDGTEHDPFGTFTISDSAVSPAGFTGIISTPNSGSPVSVDADYDDFKIGYTGYGSSELFIDPLSGSGFSLWDVYDAGSPGTLLAESGGIANINCAPTSQTATAQIALNSIPITYRNTYWTWRTKCRSSTYADAAFYNASYSTVSFGGNVIILWEYGDRVHFGPTFGTGPRDHVDVALNDGNWHTVGVRVEIFSLPNPPPPEPPPITFGTSVETEFRVFQ